MMRKRSNQKSEPRKRIATGAAVMQPRVTDALTRALFIEWARVGYAALSLEAVAKRAGVGKAALYRRWPSKLAIVTDRLETVGVDITGTQDTGSLEGDLRAFLFSLRDLLRHRLVRQILADLHAEMTRNSQLADRVRNRLQKERRSRGSAILQKAIARNEIAAGTHEELFNDVGAAALYWRMVITGGTADDHYVEALVQMILHASKPQCPTTSQ
jgi:AcrR family transcriptional regulator